MARSCGVACYRCLRSRGYGLAGHLRRHLRRDGARPDDSLRRASIRDQQGGASRRMVVRQRLGARCAKDTLDTATALGLTLCFTPVRSPESNGIAEAFVKTFKRDYARLSILPDAETVIALLPAWFEDYNEVHPHSGLKFLSPREFLRLSALVQPATCPVKRGAHQWPPSWSLAA